MATTTLKRLFLSQLIVIMIFFLLTLTNEVFDIPHLIFGDVPTTFHQRIGEICIEFIFFTAVISIEITLIRKHLKRIKILEGLLHICANCKQIRGEDNQWQKIENYISEHSLSQFSHGLCPNCAKELYPDFYRVKAPEGIKSE